MTLAAFFLLSIATSWACWVPLVLDDATISAPLWRVQLGALGPLLAVAALLARPAQREQRAAFWQRLTQPRRLLSAGGLLAVMVPAAILFAARGTWHAAGGIALPAIGMAEFLPLAGALFLLGVVPEELAWRGYALPEWLKARDPISVALLLGLAWNIWQLPLFLVPGSYQSALGSAAGLLHAINIMAESLLMCALYRLSGSVWTALVFRGMTALAGEIWQLPVAVELHRYLWTIAAALVVLTQPRLFRMAEPVQSRAG